MRTFFSALLFSAALFLQCPSAHTQQQLAKATTAAPAHTEALSHIQTAIQVGSSKELGRFFETNIKLNLDDEPGTFSASQAEIMLRNFFDKFEAQRFEYIHQGEIKNGNRYLIGKYKHASGSFRVFIQLKQEGAPPKIHALYFTKN